jgi:hypothetical protein
MGQDIENEKGPVGETGPDDLSQAPIDEDQREETLLCPPLPVQRELTSADFLARFRAGGPWDLSWIGEPPPGEKRAIPHCDRCATPGDAALWAARNDGKNQYFNPAELRAPVAHKATKKDVARSRWLWIDVDPEKLGKRAASMSEAECRAHYAAEKARILADVRTLEPRPTLVIDTGNGYQCLWRLREVVECPTEAAADAIEARNRWLGQKIRGADDTWNIDRILRLPGTRNVGSAKKRGDGITWKSEAAVVEELTDWELEYDLAAFGTVAAPNAPAQQGGQVIAFPRELPAVDLDQLLPGHALAGLRQLIRTGADPNRKEPFASRSEALYAAACGLARVVSDDGMILGVLMDPRNAISESILEKGRGARRYAERQVNRARAAEAAAKGEFEQTRRGILGNYRNARLAIQKLGIMCEHDQFADRMIIGGHAIQEWQGDLSDTAVAMLRQIILDKHNFDPGKTNVHDAAVALCAENGHHPIRDYLDELRWDGVKRIDNWLSTHLGAESNGLTQAIGRLVLIAAVRRVRRPGSKFDFVLILEDEQGTGKSTAIRILAGDDHFSDEDLLSKDSKERIEALEGVWIYELSELGGMPKGDVNSIKAFASRQVDQVRPAYGRHKVRRKRQCIFIGSTNEEHYLQDETGNRRWWPVTTGKIDLVALRRDRDQLWAEAAAEEAKIDGDLELERALWAAAREEQEKRMPQDPWVPALESVKGAVIEQMERVKTADLLAVHLSIPKERQNHHMPKRLKRVMRRLGWDGPKVMKFGQDGDGGDIVARGYERPAKAPAKERARAADSGDESLPFF